MALSRDWRSVRTLLSEYDVLAVLSSIWFAILFVRYLFPPLFPLFQDLYGVGNAATGLLFSVLMATYALMQFPSGVLADRFQRHHIITGGTVVFSLAALLVIVPGGFPILLVAVALIGLGTGAYKTVAIHILSDVYPTQSGQAIGLMDAVGQFGGVIAPAVIVALLSTKLDWRLGFVLTAVGGIGLAVLNNRRVGAHANAVHSPATDTDAEAETSSATDTPSYFTAFLDPGFGMFVLACMLYTFSWSGLSAFLPMYLIQQKALAPNVANLIYGSLFAMTVSQLVTGNLSDRMGALPIMTGLFFVVVTATAILLLTTATIVIVAAVFILGGAIHGLRPVRSSYLVTIIPESVGGGTLGIVRTLMASLGAAAPAIVGVLAERRGMQTAFSTVGVAFTVAFLLVLAVTVRARIRDEDKEAT